MSHWYVARRFFFFKLATINCIKGFHCGLSIYYIICFDSITLSYPSLSSVLLKQFLMGFMIFFIYVYNVFEPSPVTLTYPLPHSTCYFPKVPLFYSYVMLLILRCTLSASLWHVSFWAWLISLNMVISIWQWILKHDTKSISNIEKIKNWVFQRTLFSKWKHNPQNGELRKYLPVTH